MKPLGVYSPELWDPANRARMTLENLPLGDVLAVLAQWEGRYVSVELWPHSETFQLAALSADGHLAADDRSNPLREDEYAVPADVAAYHYDLWQLVELDPDGTHRFVRRGARFTVDGLSFESARLRADSRTDSPALHVEQRFDDCRLSLCVRLVRGLAC